MFRAGAPVWRGGALGLMLTFVLGELSAKLNGEDRVCLFATTATGWQGQLNDLACERAHAV